MKEESCKTCQHRSGSVCKKTNETINNLDWCGWYRFKRTDAIFFRYFQEQRIARAGNMIKGMPL